MVEKNEAVRLRSDIVSIGSNIDREVKSIGREGVGIGPRMKSIGRGRERFATWPTVSGWLSRICPDWEPTSVIRLGGRPQIRLQNGRIRIRAH